MLKAQITEYFKGKKWQTEPPCGFRVSSFKTEDHGNLVFSRSWCIGGVTGGNCWSSGGHHGITADEEPGFEALDSFLEMLVPAFRFLDYKKVWKLVNTSDGCCSEYYGNYTEYRVMWIRITELGQLLEELGYESLGSPCE